MDPGTEEGGGVAEIVVVHGVGGPHGESEWIEPLNTRLAGLGFPRLRPPGDTVHVADYSSAFDATGGVEAPEVTYRRPAEAETRRRLELEYAGRQRDIQRIAHRHGKTGHKVIQHAH